MSRHVAWRLAVPEDQLALDAMHKELEHKVGRRMDRPDLFMEPVLVCVVGEVEGKIVQGFYLEAEAESCACGISVLTSKEMADGVAMLEAVARTYKIRLVRCFVPQQLVPENPLASRPSAIQRVLEKFGFVRERPGYQQFFRWLARRP